MTLPRFSSNPQAVKADLKQAFKGAIVPFVIMLFSCLGRFAFSVFEALSGLHTISDGVTPSSNFSETVAFTKDKISVALIADGFGQNVINGMIFFGMLFALFSYRFIMKKNNVNFFLSAPISRFDLFKNRAIAAITYMAGALFISLSIDVIINSIFVRNVAYVIQIAIHIFFAALVYCISSFALFSLAFAIMHTAVEGFFFGIALMLLPSTIIVSIDNLCSGFLRNYRSSMAMDMMIFDASTTTFPVHNYLSKTAIINPLYFGKAFGQSSVYTNIFDFGYLEAYEPKKLEYPMPSISYIAPFIIWAIASILIISAACYLFINRKSERAGIHGSTPWATLMFATEGAIGLASILGFAFASEKTSSGYIALFVTFVIPFLIAMSISKRNPFHKLKTYIYSVAVGGVLVVVALVLSAGGFGFSSYVPDAKNVEMVSVQSQSVNIMPNEAATYWSSNVIGLTDQFQTVNGIYTSEKDIELVIDIIDDVSKKSDSTQNANIEVMYQLKNGKRVFREYSNIDIKTMERLVELADTDAYREELEYLLTDNSGEDSSLTKNAKKYDISFDEDYLISSEYQNKTILNYRRVYFSRFSQPMPETFKQVKNTAELRQALCDDLLASKLSDRYYSDEKLLGIIRFDGNSSGGELDMSSDVYYYYDDTISFRVYPSMKNTVEYLKSVGIELDNDPFEGFVIKGAYIDKVSTLKTNDDDDLLSYFFYSDPINSTFEYDPESGAYVSIAGEYYGDELEFDLESVYSSRKLTDVDKIKDYMEKGRLYGYATPDDYIMVVICDINDQKNVNVPILIPANEMAK